MTFRFARGDKVVLKARPDVGMGVVTDVLLAADEPQFEVVFKGGAPQTYGARHLDLAPEASDHSDPISLLKAGTLADAETFRTFMILAKLERPLADNLYSFAASRTERLPHQFKPVLKLLSSPYGRLLIADEVGLGKTIEAGIILTELNARSSLDHVLVACPSPLTVKWQREMRERFLLDFDILDGAGFRDFVHADAHGPSPEPRRVIASLELMRREENVDALLEAQPRIDVVVVDEAHHARNTETSTHGLVDLLGGLTETLIFLTATPLNLGRQDFFNLMRLLVPDEFPSFDAFQDAIAPNRHLNSALRALRNAPPSFRDALDALKGVARTASAERFDRSPSYRATLEVLRRGAAGEEIDRARVVQCQRTLIDLNPLSHIFTRTRKREVQELFPTRRAHPIRVEFTDAEHDFYDAVTDWALATYADRAAHLVAATFQRLASSCLPALGARLSETVRTGSVTLGADEAAELADDGALATDMLDAALAGGEVALAVESPSAVDQLLAAWKAYHGRTDSKYDAFEEALRELFVAGADRVLVFSYFTGTIDYLAERLTSLELGALPLRVVKLYGPMSAQQRDEAVTEFRNDTGPIVMLSSEVGSEGLDFQFCSRMFNYDLPWNPMRVEQRIGRLDRYGQTSELIHIVNMVVSDTIEERIFFRLYERIKIFEDSIGDLDAILGERDYSLGQLQRDALSGRLTDAELDKRRNQVADVILRRKQENEVFEEQSRQFLSNDDVFVDLFQDISRSRRYITPEQLQLLVERYLAVSGAQVRLEPGPSGSGRLRLTGAVAELRVQLARAVARETSGARAARHFLTRLGDDGLELTFDPAVAMRNRSLEFVSLHHPLVRALAAEPAMRADASPCGAVAVDAGLSLGVPYVFFIFEIEARGLKDSLQLAALVVDADGVEVPDAGAALLGALDSAVTYTGALPDMQVDELRTISLDWISREVAARERELQARNDETVSAQIESLRLSTSRRRLWLAEQVENSRSESIRRMHRSQLARQESEYAARLERLEDGRLISIGHRLIATGVVAAKAPSGVHAG